MKTIRIKNICNSSNPIIHSIPGSGIISIESLAVSLIPAPPSENLA